MKLVKLTRLTGTILLCALLLLSCTENQQENKNDVQKNPNQTQVDSGENSGSAVQEAEKETPLVTKLTATDDSPGDYYNLSPICNGFFSVINHDFSMGIINSDLEVILPCEYSTHRSPVDNIIAIRNQNGLWGYFDIIAEKFILECKYKSVFDFSEGLGCHYDGEVYRYINSDGTPAFEGEFFEAAAFSDGLARVVSADGVGYIDKTGKFVIHCDYADFDDFHEGLARVSDEQTLGYIGKDGNLKLKLNCDGMFPFKDGLAAIGLNEKIGYIDSDGNLDIAPEYDAPKVEGYEYFRFECGVAPVMKDGKYGFIDKKGELVINPEYDLVLYAIEDIIRVRKDKLYGYITTSGDIITECIFTQAGSFKNGIAKVRDADGKYYYINKEGKELTTERFDDATDFNNGTAFAIKQGTDTWIKITAE